MAEQQMRGRGPLRGNVEAQARLQAVGLVGANPEPEGFPILRLAATSGVLGQYLAKKYLDLAFGATAFGTIPATLYLALLSDTNTDAQRAGGTYTELANANAYARTAIANNATNWPAATLATPSVKSNGVAIVPPTPTGSLWTIINGILITDSPTIGAGNIFATGSLVNPIGAGATSVTFPIGSIVISF